MMKIYILSAHEYSDWTLLGIYSTREKAESDKAHYERPRKVDWQDEPFHERANDIQEFTLDERCKLDEYRGDGWNTSN